MGSRADVKTERCIRSTVLSAIRCRLVGGCAPVSHLLSVPRDTSSSSAKDAWVMPIRRRRALIS